MLIAEARVRTDRPDWYLEQMLNPRRQAGSRILHVLRLLHGGTPPPLSRHVEQSAIQGTINFTSGRCILHVGSDVLTLRVEASDQDSLQSIQHLIAGRLQKIGKHDVLPQVTWQRVEVGVQQYDETASAEGTTLRPRRSATLGVVAVIALVVAVHLGLGGLLLASGPWKHWVIGAVLTVVLLRAAYVFGRLVRRKRAPNAS